MVSLGREVPNSYRDTRYSPRTAGPKYLDLIQFDGSNGWEEIRSVTNWDMSFFGEDPDFLLVT
ncbi:glycoprotein [Pseudomonas aeruginosa]|nr:glycoprotein [Pseudomonas aeruginosa]